MPEQEPTEEDDIHNLLDDILEKTSTEMEGMSQKLDDKTEEIYVSIRRDYPQFDEEQVKSHIRLSLLRNFAIKLGYELARHNIPGEADTLISEGMSHFTQGDEPIRRDSFYENLLENIQRATELETEYFRRNRT